ncbi:MAG: hypothetical protein QXZ25_04700 [Candidatus Bathyarchaeia archaeon]
MAKIVNVMQECYSKLMPHEVSLVDLYLFERASSVEAFFAKERSELGVVTESFNGLFFAMHDAWRGTPRITICLEKLGKLPELVKLGGIHHEVGHTVLHGSLQYYLLPFPPSLLEMANRFNFPPEYSRNLLYLVSIAVKDYEVTRLLYQRGYVEDQVAYAKFLLKASEDDIFSWEISQGKPLPEALCLIAHLKAVGCAAPLLVDKKFGKEVKQLMEEGLRYLPADHFNTISKVVEEGFASMGTDTLRNIDNLMHKCNLIFDTAFKRVLKV